MSIRITLSILALASLALAGCDLTLTAITMPPPSAVADLDSGCETITLTRGAALGVACDDVNHPCENMSVEVADLAIADARLSYSTDFVDLYVDRQATTFVIFGKSEGETSVTVRSSGGDQTYDVKVLPRE